MTAERIAELRGLLAEATPGPWKVLEREDDHLVVFPRVDGEPWSRDSSVLNRADAAFIAATHNALPELLEAAERLVMVQAELDVLRGVACEEGQAMGRGRCGACVCCLRAACERKDALLAALADEGDNCAVSQVDVESAREEVGKR